MSRGLIFRGRAAWSPEDDAALAVFWANGMALADMGQRLRRTENAVRCRVFTLGLPPRHHAGVCAPLLPCEVARAHSVVRLSGFAPDSQRAAALARRFGAGRCEVVP